MKRWCVRMATSRIPAVMLALVVASSTWGQVFQLTREQMLQYTAQNPFDRFPDGRPKVPDDLLVRMKEMSAEEVLGLASEGFATSGRPGGRYFILKSV